jgi:ferric-dicitrate binding protein FerR (iron transport regulator)
MTVSNPDERPTFADVTAALAERAHGDEAPNAHDMYQRPARQARMIRRRRGVVGAGLAMAATLALVVVAPWSHHGSEPTPLVTTDTHAPTPTTANPPGSIPEGSAVHLTPGTKLGWVLEPSGNVLLATDAGVHLDHHQLAP